MRKFRITFCEDSANFFAILRIWVSKMRSESEANDWFFSAKRSEFASLSQFFAILRIRNANLDPCLQLKQHALRIFFRFFFVAAFNHFLTFLLQKLYFDRHLLDAEDIYFLVKRSACNFVKNNIQVVLLKNEILEIIVKEGGVQFTVRFSVRSSTPKIFSAELSFALIDTISLKSTGQKICWIICLEEIATRRWIPSVTVSVCSQQTYARSRHRC